MLVSTGQMTAGRPGLIEQLKPLAPPDNTQPARHTQQPLHNRELALLVQGNFKKKINYFSIGLWQATSVVPIRRISGNCLRQTSVASEQRGLK
jgi:hypothetical protein